jgi:hypothetical protein
MKALIAAVLFALFNRSSAPAQNLIPDPTFSSGISGWTIRGAPFNTMLAWNNSAGSDGTPGFARLTEIGGLGPFFARTCLPVEAETTYSWGGFLRLAPAPPAGAFFDLVFFADSSCESEGLLEQRAPLIETFSSNPGVWYSTPGPDIVAPPTAASVAFEVTLEVADPVDGYVDFDNVYFGPQGVGPPSVPVSVPALSEAALLLLAIALAIIAVRQLTTR